MVFSPAFFLPFFITSHAVNSTQLGGPCNRGICPIGWSCSDNHCLPLQDPTGAIGPCLVNEPQKCPWGYHCLSGGCYRNPDSHTAIGPCQNSLCPEGFYCFIGECVRYNPK